MFSIKSTNCQEIDANQLSAMSYTHKQSIAAIALLHSAGLQQHWLGTGRFW